MVMIDTLPPAFDPETYRARNPELAGLDDAAAAAHYRETGRAAGLIASPLGSREGLLERLAGAGRVLEIGPFCRPLLTGPDIEYLDVLDADGLRARAIKLGMDPAGCPERIHHVGRLAQVTGRFDAVVSSHAIEHQPDLIGHLREVERVLEPDGGFFLIVPDKRYCFDHFLAPSTVAQVLQAHHERRARHTLASVVEHTALVTHNDPARHWAGDHGDPTRDRAERVRGAMRRFHEAGDAYLDVHAWQFTPDSFREVIGTLGALGLTGLEVAEVYDTAHGRNEFCAVLRLSRDARAQRMTEASGIAVTVIQTADPEQYRPMLEATSRTARAFCIRWGHAYESYVGIKRGPHAWQASYNRILQLRELKERGFRGWVLHLDADAYVFDLDFDLGGYLADKSGYGAIFATAGVSERRWDVNDGVGLINLGHEQGVRLADAWHDAFMALSDDHLAEAEAWLLDGNDQELLHRILERDSAIDAATLVEGKDILNWPQARFVRQHLRTFTPGLEARTAAIAAETDAILRRHGEPVPIPATDRWAARLRHPVALIPPLIEAATRAPDLAGAERIKGEFHPDDDVVEPHQRAFAEALARGDLETVAGELAALGKSNIGKGLLGGRQQHERAREPLFAERLALWTHDRLVSLTEAVGALPAESPEAGRWDVNARMPPAELFALLEQALGADLTPPAHVGGYLGIAVRDGVVLHMRMLDAIYAAWRLRRIADAQYMEVDTAICELAGGIGLTAFYARRLGLVNYRLIDGPVQAALQSHVLRDSAAMDIASWSDMGGQCDVLFNADTLPGLSRERAVSALRHAAWRGAQMLLSINQEAGLPGQASVAELVGEAGGWRLAGRHPYWLRAGWVESVWFTD